MQKKSISLSFGIIIGLLIICTILVFTKNVKAQYEYGVSVEIIGEREKHIDVRPGQAGTSLLDFKVTNTGEGNAWERVELSPTTLAGWQTAVSQSFLILNQGESKDVTIYITANRNEFAPFTTFTELFATVTDGSNGPPKVPAEARDIGTLVIDQYSYIMFDAEIPYERIGPGKESIFTFKISNIGNGQDELKFAIANIEELENNGWTVVRPENLIIQPGKKEIIRLSVRTPKGIWKDEVHTIQLYAKSARDVKYSEDSFMTLWVRGMHIPGFEPMFSILTVGMIAVVVSRKVR